MRGGGLKGPGGFELGAVIATPGTREAFSGSYLASCVTRHASDDWGDLTEEERRLNDLALEEGGELVSFYRDSEGERGLYIITTAERSKTTNSVLRGVWRAEVTPGPRSLHSLTGRCALFTAWIAK